MLSRVCVVLFTLDRKGVTPFFNFCIINEYIHTYIYIIGSLMQHVDFPTHIHGYWLDLFITRTACDLIKTVHPSDGLSDHMTVIAEVGVKLISHSIKKCFSYRYVKGIPLTDFISDIELSSLISHPKLTCSELYQQYHTVLPSLLDKYAPIKTKKITPKPPNPWMTMEIQLAKRLRQKLERIWRRTRSCLDRSRYRKQENLCNKMMSDARRRYYADCINETSENPRTLWKTINNILHRTQSSSIPAFLDIKSLSESFSKFFIDKIEKIRMNFTNDVHNTPVIESPTVKSRTTRFEPATADEVRKLIINSPSKTCDLDPIPTELLKSCLDVLLVPITQMKLIFDFKSFSRHF